MNETLERLRNAIDVWELQHKEATAYSETLEKETRDAVAETLRLHWLVETLKEAEREIERLSSVSTGRKPPHSSGGPNPLPTTSPPEGFRPALRHGENPDPPPAEQRPDPPVAPPNMPRAGPPKVQLHVPGCLCHSCRSAHQMELEAAR